MTDPRELKETIDCFIADMSAEIRDQRSTVLNRRWAAAQSQLLGVAGALSVLTVAPMVGDEPEQPEVVTEEVDPGEPPEVASVDEEPAEPEWDEDPE